MKGGIMSRERIQCMACGEWHTSGEKCPTCEMLRMQREVAENSRKQAENSRKQAEEAARARQEATERYYRDNPNAKQQEWQEGFQAVYDVGKLTFAFHLLLYKICYFMASRAFPPKNLKIQHSCFGTFFWGQVRFGVIGWFIFMFVSIIFLAFLDLDFPVVMGIYFGTLVVTYLLMIINRIKKNAPYKNLTGHFTLEEDSSRYVLNITSFGKDKIAAWDVLYQVCGKEMHDILECKIIDFKDIDVKPPVLFAYAQDYEKISGLKVLFEQVGGSAEIIDRNSEVATRFSEQFQQESQENAASNRMSDGQPYEHTDSCEQQDKSSFLDNCPHCQTLLEIKNEWKGLEIECPECHGKIYF